MTGAPASERPFFVMASLARCADGSGTFTPLFFSDDLIDISRAKAMCARCPLRQPCLRDALDRSEPSGVWGGELVRDGRVVVKRPNGRPPKYPRPVLVTDELGVVQNPLPPRGFRPASAPR